MPRSFPATVVSALLLVLTFTLGTAAFPFDAEEVVFYPTYGFSQGTDWVIPMRAKVQESRRTGTLFVKLFKHMPIAEPGGTEFFRERVTDFLVDDESGEDVRIVFDGDPDRQQYRIAGDGRFPKTDPNGVVEGTITLSDAIARRLLAQPGATAGWLTYRAVSADHTGIGRVRLISPTGVSVISDIDDTIKVTEIPAGPRVVVANTFFKPFVPTTELNVTYNALADAAFHYVSGGPWQLYRPVSAFLIGGRLFPEGSFHMKSLTGGIRTPITSAEHLYRFVQPDGTVQHKQFEIARIMRRFPGRRFVLIGDSGEHDPEVYRRVKEEFGAQVQEIIIRDVTNSRTLAPARLSGMTIVEAPTPVAGLSQSHSQIRTVLERRP